jgi:hypothetical protein
MRRARVSQCASIQTDQPAHCRPTSRVPATTADEQRGGPARRSENGEVGSLDLDARRTRKGATLTRESSGTGFKGKDLRLVKRLVGDSEEVTTLLNRPGVLTPPGPLLPPPVLPSQRSALCVCVVPGSLQFRFPGAYRATCSVRRDAGEKRPHIIFQNFLLCLDDRVPEHPASVFSAAKVF